MQHTSRCSARRPSSHLVERLVACLHCRHCFLDLFLALLQMLAFLIHAFLDCRGRSLQVLLVCLVLTHFLPQAFKCFSFGGQDLGRQAGCVFLVCRRAKCFFQPTAKCLPLVFDLVVPFPHLGSQIFNLRVCLLLKHHRLQLFVQLICLVFAALLVRLRLAQMLLVVVVFLALVLDRLLQFVDLIVDSLETSIKLVFISFQ